MSITLALAAPARAQEPKPEPKPESAATLNARAMQLLREQKFEQAADAAERATRDAGGDAQERAAGWVFLGIAKLRLGDEQAAKSALERASALLRDVPEGHWLHREAAALKSELDGKTRAEALADFEAAQKQLDARDEDLSDLGVAMWKMRYCNSVGEHRRAAEIAERILARPDEQRPDTIADVSLHLYFAQHKLGDSDRATAARARFDEIAAQLPENDTLPLQMQMLRQSLGDAIDDQRKIEPFQPGDDTFWKTGKPEDVGMAAEPLREHERMCQRSGADAVLVARDGVIVSEWYSPLYRQPVPTMSSVKSIAALLAGLLVEEGKLKLDDPVSRYVPEWNDGLAARATVRHVLTMTAGLPKRSDMGVAASGEQGMNAYAAAQRPQWEPGTRWAYSNEGAQLLSPILERAAGEPLWRYAQRRLFEPMGLEETELRRDARGNTNTYADANTTLRELAKFGTLVLNEGKWNGQQLIGRPWLNQMLAPCPSNGGYGLMWWLYEDPRVWAMEGYLNTSVWVFPDLRVVVCRVQRAPYLHASGPYDPQRMFKLIEAATSKR